MNLKIREKITGLLVFYFLVALLAIGSTLFFSWQLEGGAAAINDVGSERMRSFHIAFLLAQLVQHPSAGLRHDVESKVTQFEKVLTGLERGDHLRPVALPKEPQVRAQMGRLRRDWQSSIKPRILGILDATQQTEQERLLVEYRAAVEHGLVAEK
jgi:two-component system, NarL family, nitrate/nitrite sensor histidine kinase NarX